MRVLDYQSRKKTFLDKNRCLRKLLCFTALRRIVVYPRLFPIALPRISVAMVES